MNDEKKTEQLKVWISEPLYLELNRLAVEDDRKLSDYVGIVLRRHVYGARVAGDGEGADRADSDRR